MERPPQPRADLVGLIAVVFTFALMLAAAGFFYVQYNLGSDSTKSPRGQQPAPQRDPEETDASKPVLGEWTVVIDPEVSLCDLQLDALMEQVRQDAREHEKEQERLGPAVDPIDLIRDDNEHTTHM